MATMKEVKKLAALARIKVTDAELGKFTSEFDAILAYVETVSTVEMLQGEALQRGQIGEEKPLLRNVMRADGEPHTSGAYTEKLTAQFPTRSSSAEATEDKEGNYLVVKQIISHD